MSSAAGTSPYPTPRISEIVLKTARYRELRQWYARTLGIEPFFERSDVDTPSWTGAYSVAFFRLHLDYPYTQVLALFEIPAAKGAATQTGGEAGMHHMQLRHVGLEHLFSRYEILKQAGIEPYRCFNHGPSTSFYYKDPDSNVVEMSATNFPDEAQYLAYFRSDAYRRNISGIEIDPQTYVGRFRAGTPLPELVRIDA